MSTALRQGNAGLRGSGAEFLKLHKKNFDGSLTAFVDINVDLDQNWCPVAKLSVSHEWRTNARLEIVDNIYIDMSSKANELISDLKKDIDKILSRILSCEKFRELISVLWRTYSFPLELPGEERLFINLVPKSFGFSGVNIESSRLGVATRLEASTSVETTETSTEVSTSLPDLQGKPWTPGQISLELPIRVTFDQLTSIVRQQLSNRTFDLASSAKAGTLTILDVETYPSGDKITLALSFTAEIPGRLFSVSGTVFLTARPLLAPDGHTVFLDDVAFSRILDNDLWNLLSVAFESEVKTLLEMHSRYDFHSEADYIETEILKAMRTSEKPAGVELRVTKPMLEAKKIFAESNQLTLVVTATMSVDAEVVTAIIG